MPSQQQFMEFALHAMSILLIVLTPWSYLPQYKKLLSVQTASGISVAATLVLALCAQSQLATMYYLFACPTYKMPGRVVPKPPQLMDYLNLTQLVVQWLCSLLMLAFVLGIRESARSNAEIDPTTVATTEQTTEQTTDPTTVGVKSPSARTALILVAAHILSCVFWAVLAGKPRDDWLDLPFVVIMGINYACINPLITIATGVAYMIQAIKTGAAQERAALSRTTIMLQIIVFSSLAVLWPFRFRVPQNLRGFDLYLVNTWYPLVGWACVNNALIACGQCIVLYTARGTARSGEQLMSRETQPLLAA